MPSNSPSVRLTLAVEILENRLLLSTASTWTTAPLVSPPVTPAAQISVVQAPADNYADDADGNATPAANTSNPLCVNGIGPLPPASGPALPAVVPPPAPPTPVLLPVREAPSDLATALLAVADAAPRGSATVGLAGNPPARTNPPLATAPVLSMNLPLTVAENGTAPAPATAASSPSLERDRLFSIEPPQGEADHVTIASLLASIRLSDEANYSAASPRLTAATAVDGENTIAPERTETTTEAVSQPVEAGAESVVATTEGTPPAPVADGDTRRGEWLAAALAFSSLLAWAHCYPHGASGTGSSGTTRWKQKLDSARPE